MTTVGLAVTAPSTGQRNPITVLGPVPAPRLHHAVVGSPLHLVRPQSSPSCLLCLLLTRIQVPSSSTRGSLPLLRGPDSPKAHAVFRGPPCGPLLQMSALHCSSNSRVLMKTSPVEGKTKQKPSDPAGPQMNTWARRGCRAGQSSAPWPPGAASRESQCTCLPQLPVPWHRVANLT